MAILIFNPGAEDVVQSFIGVAEDQNALDAGVNVNREAIKTITCSDAEFENLKRGKSYPTSYNANDVVTWYNPMNEIDSVENHENEKQSEIDAYNNIKELYPNHPQIAQINAAIAMVEAVDVSSLANDQSVFDVVYDQDNNYLHWYQVL